METKNIIQNILSTTLPILIIGDIELDLLLQGMNISAEDYLIISDEVVKIDKVKEAVRFLQFKPLKSAYRLVVIESAETMTSEAANALLKTLEEAPGKSRLILIANNEAKILPTINSRCRKIRLVNREAQQAPENYLSPEKIKNLSYAERFEYAKNVADAGEAKVTLTLWQAYFRDKMLQGNDVLKILKRISWAKGLLETNISVKLLLENLLIEM